MTWSIVACDSSGALGVAIASRFFAVGAFCAQARSGVGAVATQGLANPLYAAAALAAMAAGTDPAQIVAALSASDDGRAQRQLHMIDAQGRTAAFTGADCIGWCGQTAGAGYSVAGNMLAGAAVIEQTAATYQTGQALPFAERLLAALDAGQAAGGDKRGQQSAAIKIYTVEDYCWLDLRVDDSATPLIELRRLYQKSLERYQPFVSCLPSRARPFGITDRSLIEAEVERFHAARREVRR